MLQPKSIKLLNKEEVRRLTGISKNTFLLMKNYLTEAEVKQKKLGGRPNKLSIEERLLMMLEYFREYRTFFHTGRSYGISEAACFKNIRWVEDILIHSGLFKLPGKKVVIDCDLQIDTIIVDVTESQIQRPKKNKKNIILVKRKSIL